MAEPLEALRSYVHFLQKQEGVRQVRLTRIARQGLAHLAASVGARRSSNTSRASVAGPAAVSSAPQRTPEATPAPRTPVTVDRRATAPPLEGRPPGRPLSPPTPLPIANIPPFEISGSTKVEQLLHLQTRAKACLKCPHLVARRHNVVFGVGNPDAKLMFVGEAPGEEEDLQDEPFVGRAGQLLTKMILAMGLTREQVYIGNIVKCRPDMPEGAPGNRKPTKQEMETCVPYLRAQIEVIKPSVIVALGATSVEGLLGPIGTIGSLRGKFLEYRNVPMMPTYHPSYLLRNQSNTEKRKVWEDLLKVMERLDLPISEKQRGFFLSK